MATEMDVAKMMFGWGKHDYSFFSNFYTDGGGSGSTSVRYGTVVSIGENGQIEVRIDGSSETVWGKCDTPVRVGDRVSVVFRNGSYIFYAIKEFVQSTQDKIDDLHNEIQTSGQEIKDSVSADIQQVEDAFNDFKNTHQLTDADINTKFEQVNGEITATVEGVIDDVVGETYATKSELSVAIDGIESSVSENYQSKTDAGTMKVDLESQIKQTSDAIAMEVSDRKEAVSGAIQESKTYFDVEAGKLSTKIEDSVMNSVGESYVTKNDFEVTSGGFRSEITSAVNTANSAKTTANSASSTASSALSKANSAARTATDYLDWSSSGLEIGNDNLNANVLIAPASIKFRNGSTQLAEFNSTSIFLGQNTKTQLKLGTSEATFSKNGTDYLNFEANVGVSAIASQNGSQLQLSADDILLLSSTHGRAVQSHKGLAHQSLESSPSIASGSTWTQVFGGVLLFRSQGDGTNGTITFKNTIDNYAFLDIVFQDHGNSGWRRWCQRVYNPSLYYGGVHHYGVYVSLQSMVGGNSTLYPCSAMYEITRTQLVRRTEVSGWLNNNSACGVTESSGSGNGGTYITHVIGWR